MFSRTKTTTPTDFEQATQAVADISGDYTLDVEPHAPSASAPATRWSRRSAASSRTTRATRTSTPRTPPPRRSRLTIQAGSIDTGNADRNGHLVSPDFFDVENNPEITFVSTEVEKHSDSGETTWVITGDLTIKGVTKPVTIEFEQTGSAKDPFGNLRVGFEGSTAINRKDWGLTWNAALETGGVLVSERVKLDFDISAIQSA